MVLKCEYGTCPKCGENLNVIEEYNDVTECAEMECPHCKTRVTVYARPEEEDSEYYKINEDTTSSGYYGYDAQCPHCGSYMVWQCDFMESDFTGEEVPLEEDKLVAECLCPHCGVSVSITYSND